MHLHDFEYLVVGSGLTGAVISRILTDHGKKVVVIERRRDLGGNVHDWTHPSGIRVHTYGPHYFRTSSEAIWQFVSRFAVFYPFEAIIKARVGKKLFPWPVSNQVVQGYGNSAWQEPHDGPPQNFEDAVLRKMPIPVYREFVENYTRKQWGVSPSSLSAQLAARIEVRENQELRLKTNKYQGLPLDGYASFMKNMLSRIFVVPQTPFSEIRGFIPDKTKIIYTGPIDEFFSFDAGRLDWRGQKRRHIFLHEPLRFPVAQVNFPSMRETAIRVIEWAHMMPPESKYNGTVLTYETPFSPVDPTAFEYPFPDLKNHNLYKKYRSRAQLLANVTICGRLGEYRYYDMDQAIGRAMLIARRLLQSGSA